MGFRRIRIEADGAALGEGIGENAFGLKTALYDAGGNEVSLWQLAGGVGNFIMPNTQPRGAYRLEASFPYKIAGHTGKVTHTQRFDNTTTFSSPHLTMLRVEDGGGTLTYRVPAGTTARMVFGARDTAWYEENYPFHRPIRVEATRAWWRPHGTAEWQPLSVTAIGSDFEHRGELPGPAGNIYSASLGPATIAPGEIDVKIQVADIYTGVSDIVFEPVLIVDEPQTKRRAVR
jgi:hypothetical protein